MLLCHEYNTTIYGTFACLLSSLAVGQVAVAVYKLAPFVREFLFAFDKRGMQQQHVERTPPLLFLMLCVGYSQAMYIKLRL